MAKLGNITFCTYNIKGYDGVAADTIKDIMPTCSFLLLQETRKYEQEFIDQLKRDFEDCPYDCISVNKNDSREMRVGPIKNGISICYHSNTNCIIENIPTKSKCFCVQKMKIDQICLLIFSFMVPWKSNLGLSRTLSHTFWMNYVHLPH